MLLEHTRGGEQELFSHRQNTIINCEMDEQTFGHGLIKSNAPAGGPAGAAFGGERGNRRSERRPMGGSAGAAGSRHAA
jgi:hypothetical protein